MNKELENKIAEMSKSELKEFIRSNPHEVAEYAKENGVFAYKLVIMFSDILDSIEHFINLVK